MEWWSNGVMECCPTPRLPVSPSPRLLPGNWQLATGNRQLTPPVVPFFVTGPQVCPPDFRRLRFTAAADRYDSSWDDCGRKSAVMFYRTSAVEYLFGGGDSRHAHP